MVEYLPERPKLNETELEQYLKAFTDDQVQVSIYVLHATLPNHVFFFRLILFIKLMTVVVEAIQLVHNLNDI